jgi:L-fuculose-phosphate aldolase
MKKCDLISPGHEKSLACHRREICVVGRWLLEHGYIVSTEGNISVRLSGDRILASPSGCSKGWMSPASLVITDLEGRKISGTNAPSSELAMHLLIYRLRPEVNAVCHAHPVVATGFAAAAEPLNKAILCEMVVALGTVPLARYGTPGTPELAAALAPLVPHYDAILMSNHGVVTYGTDLLSAFHRMELVEHYARVSLVAATLGKQSLLSSGDVEKLLAARTRYGVTVPEPDDNDLLVVASETEPALSRQGSRMHAGDRGRDRDEDDREDPKG